MLKFVEWLVVKTFCHNCFTTDVVLSESPVSDMQVAMQIQQGILERLRELAKLRIITSPQNLADIEKFANSTDFANILLAKIKTRGYGGFDLQELLTSIYGELERSHLNPGIYQTSTGQITWEEKIKTDKDLFKYLLAVADHFIQRIGEREIRGIRPELRRKGRVKIPKEERIKVYPTAEPLDTGKDKIKKIIGAEEEKETAGWEDLTQAIIDELESNLQYAKNPNKVERLKQAIEVTKLRLADPFGKAISLRKLMQQTGITQRKMEKIYALIKNATMEVVYKHGSEKAKNYLASLGEPQGVEDEE